MRIIQNYDDIINEFFKMSLLLNEDEDETSIENVDNSFCNHKITVPVSIQREYALRYNYLDQQKKTDRINMAKNDIKINGGKKTQKKRQNKYKKKKTRNKYKTFCHNYA